ncbi:MAG: PIN domain-containing protein [Bacteroidota bacterium]
MVIIVDANILIQCIIGIKGKTAALILENSSYVDFVIPEFVLEEISGKESKIYLSSNLKKPEFDRNLRLLLTHLVIISDDEIPGIIFKKAYEIVKNIDVKDAIYVAFSIVFESLLWTDDFKLQRGLKRNGFNSIVNTKEFKEIIKGLK